MNFEKDDTMFKTSRIIISIVFIVIILIGMLVYQNLQVSKYEDIINQYQKRSDATFIYLINYSDNTEKLITILEDILRIDYTNKNDEILSLFTDLKKEIHPWRVNIINTVHLADINKSDEMIENSIVFDYGFENYYLSPTSKRQHEIMMDVNVRDLDDIINVIYEEYVNYKKISKNSYIALSEINKSLINTNEQINKLKKLNDIPNNKAIDDTKTYFLEIIDSLNNTIDEIGSKHFSNK